jgi:hypothetical protein
LSLRCFVNMFCTGLLGAQWSVSNTIDSQRTSKSKATSIAQTAPVITRQFLAGPGLFRKVQPICWQWFLFFPPSNLCIWSKQVWQTTTNTLIALPCGAKAAPKISLWSPGEACCYAIENPKRVVLIVLLRQKGSEGFPNFTIKCSSRWTKWCSSNNLPTLKSVWMKNLVDETYMRQNVSVGRIVTIYIGS